MTLIERNKEAIRRFLKQYPQIVVISGIAFVSFILFYVLFQQSSSVDYFREIVAALIATLLAATITTMLLKAQTTGEEIKERNVEVFKRKVEIYDAFLGSIIEALADNDISEEEAKQLRKQIYLLSLFSSPETVEIAVRYVRGHMLKDMDQDQTLHELVQAFREELKLEASDGGITSELEGIESLLTMGYEHRHQYEKIRDFFDGFSDKLLDRVDMKEGDEWVSTAATGMIGGLNVDIESARGTQYFLQLTYPTDPNFVELHIVVFIDLSEADAVRRSQVENAAIQCKFSWEDDDLSDRFTDGLLQKAYTMKCRRSEEGNVTILGATAVKNLAADLNAIERQLSD
jgi:hypothetical protein